MINQLRDETNPVQAESLSLQISRNTVFLHKQINFLSGFLKGNVLTLAKISQHLCEIIDMILNPCHWSINSVKGSSQSPTI